MAVYKRTYKAYGGALTSRWQRLWVIPRFAWRGMFKQRFLTIFFAVCFFYPLGCALVIYLNNNLGFVRQYFPVPPGGFLEIGDRFFYAYTSAQCTMAFLLAAMIGPGLISPDLVNNGLPLFFSRPISRTEYVVQKIMVIASLLSLITWIPGLMLFGLQASLADSKWLSDNLHLAWAIFSSCSLWILFVSVLALALSAWVRWKIVAGALMLVVMFVGAGLGEMIKQVARTDMGRYLDVVSNMANIWLRLFRINDKYPLTIEESIGVALAFTAVCILLLARKIKACEVVRG